MSQPAPADVQADAGQPGAEPLGAPQPVQAEQRLEDCLLGRVARQVRVGERPPTERTQQRPMPLDELGKRGLVAIARELD